MKGTGSVLPQDLGCRGCPEAPYRLLEPHSTRGDWGGEGQGDSTVQAREIGLVAEVVAHERLMERAQVVISTL